MGRNKPDDRLGDRISERTVVAVLQAMATSGPLSRNTLARRCGVSPSVVSRAVAELQRAGLVSEEEPPTRPGRPGRPERLVRLNGKVGYVLGANLSGARTDAVLVDLRGRQVAHARAAARSPTPQDLIELVGRLRDRLVRSAGIPLRRVVACGLSVAGLVDRTQGRCIRSTVLGWTDVPLEAMAAERLGDIPVHVANDANAVALGERLFGDLRDVEDAVVVTVGSGIGTGIFAGGRLVTGATGGAGELGHLTVQPDGMPCRCGKRGCLETVASLPAMVARLQAVTGRPVDPDRLGELLRQDDRDVTHVAAAAGQAMGLALAHAVNLLNPEIILLVTEVADLSPLSPFITDTLQLHAQPDLLAATRLVFKRLPPTMWSLGAARLALDRLFSSLEWLTRPEKGVG